MLSGDIYLTCAVTWKLEALRQGSQHCTQICAKAPHKTGCTGTVFIHACKTLILFVLYTLTQTLVENIMLCI